MSNKKLGVALSVYNKIDHLATNINIIRKSWNCNNDAFISVCCNDEKSFEAVKNLKIDFFTSGNHLIESSPKPFRRLRIFDCIRSSILGCEADFVIHYHADAYALDSREIVEIIDLMKKEDFDVAYRGRGIDYRSPKNICGDVDDHFLIFRRESLVKSKIFEVDYNQVLNFLSVGNPETLLSKLISEGFESNKIFHYSDMFENQVEKIEDSFYEDNIMHRAMNPYNFDNGRKFLHFGNVDREFIVENLTSRGITTDLICV